MGTLKEEPLVRASVKTFEPIHEGVAQGIVALLGATNFILLGEVFNEDGGKHEEFRNLNCEIGN
jgi:hypothetical protein